MTTRCLFTLAFAILALRAMAQYPYGDASTGSTGAVLGLRSFSQASIANVGYGHEITGGIPNSAGLIGISLRSGSTPVAGAQIFLGLPEIVAIGTFTTDGGGSAFHPLPIPSSTLPGNAGLLFHVQAAMPDPLNPLQAIASRGLLVEVTLPSFAIVVGEAATALVFHYVDVGSSAILGADAPFAGIAALGAAIAFGQGGTEIFAAPIGPSSSTVLYGTLTGIPPNWTVMTPAFPNLIGLGYHRARRRLHVVADSRVHAVDADPASATFGAVIATSTPFLPVAARPVFAEIGNRVALTNESLVGTVTLQVMDTDPDSPGYLTFLANAPSPGAIATPAGISPDGRTILVWVLGFGSPTYGLAVFDVLTGTWSGPLIASGLGLPPIPGLFSFARDGSHGISKSGATTFSRFAFPAAPNYATAVLSSLPALPLVPVAPAPDLFLARGPDHRSFVLITAGPNPSFPSAPASIRFVDSNSGAALGPTLVLSGSNRVIGPHYP